MSLPAFSFPFAHWTPSALSVTTTFDAIISKFIKDRLLLGLASGEISVFTVDDDTNVPYLQARLLGHQSPIVSLEYLETVSETATVEPLFLSLSADGALSKWSFADNRCLQALSSTTSDSTKPRGMVVIAHSGVGEGRLTDSLVLVYGCNTEIVVLNAESLETVFVWTGHIDWPIPLAVGSAKGEGEARECALLTILPNGEVQSWVMTGKREKKPTSVLTIRRIEGRPWGVDYKPEWGRVRWWQKLVNGYLVAQGRGLSFHMAVPEEERGFVKTCEVAVEEEIVSIEMGVAQNQQNMVIKTEDGSIRVATLRADRLDIIAAWSPTSFLESDQIMSVAAFFDANLRKGKLAVSSRLKITAGAPISRRPGLDISIADITGENTNINAWNERALTKSLKLDGKYNIPSTCSEIFSNMLAVACGMNIDLYSASAFLLSYHEPTTSIALDRDEDASICLLKQVRINAYIGPGQNAGVYGGKEYLVVGTQSGGLSLIEAPSYQCSPRLSLFPGAVFSAHLLPSDLGRRIRSALLVSSIDGTVSIIDVERPTALATFPNHGYSRLALFATKKGRNVVALVYRDGVRREWNMGEEVGGVLLNPPPSRGSAHSQDDTPGEGGLEWRVVRLDSAMDREGREDEGESGNGDGSLQLWNGFCRIGLPTAAVNIRAILDSLDRATRTASQRARPSERRVVGNHPAIVNAKSLLTALVPEGDLGSFLDCDGCEEREFRTDEVEEWKFAVNQFLYKRRRPAVLGQIGAGHRVSMLTPEAMMEEEVSPTLTSVKLLAVLTLVSMLLEATGKKDLVNGVLKRMIRNHLGRQKVALGAFAKFWSDSNPTIRWVARECLDAFMSALTENEREIVVGYWRSYLPVHVPPELSSAKEVVRSVILLGKLITDYGHDCNDSLKKTVALSAELLLHESDPIYQDTAIEMIGYSWTPFQNFFDAYSAIHSLIRISATTLPTPRREIIHRCFLEIAAKNSPLLASSLANNISSGSPSSGPTASLSTVQLQELAEISAAAMRIVTYIARTTPALFNEVLSILIEAVLKILDPNSGLREKVLSAVTELVEALVKSYSTLAFHRPSQRLALSAGPGVIGVYDLKTSQTSYVLDGHHNLATYLTFNADGKCLAALDRIENLLLIWRFGGGLLSYLGTEGEKPLQPRVKKPYGDGEIVEVVWKAERKAAIRLADGSEVEAGA